MTLFENALVWWVSVTATIFMSLWASGDLGSNNLSRNTLHDFTVAALIFALVGLIASLQYSFFEGLLISGAAALTSGVLINGVPASLHASTVLYIIAGVQIALAVWSFWHKLRPDNDEDDVLTYRSQRTALLVMLLITCAAPQIWGYSRTEWLMVIVAVAAGLFALLMSLERPRKLNIYMPLAGGFVMAAFGTAVGNPYAASIIATAGVAVFGVMLMAGDADWRKRRQRNAIRYRAPVY